MFRDCVTKPPLRGIGRVGTSSNRHLQPQPQQPARGTSRINAAWARFASGRRLRYGSAPKPHRRPSVGDSARHLCGKDPKCRSRCRFGLRWVVGAGI